MSMKKGNLIYLSSLLQTESAYKNAADNLSAAFDAREIKYTWIDHTKDIWLRDFMPVKTRSGKYVSFRYEPSYLADAPNLRTDFRRDIAPQLGVSVCDSDINLDGGNVVFSPSKRRVIISDRVFSENPERERAGLIRELEKQLEAEVLLIPSLRSDMTGHADGMVRFVDETTVIGNAVPFKKGFEQRVKDALKSYGVHVIDFPFFFGKGGGVGCYLNFLQTEQCIFLPAFGSERDAEAVSAAKSIFNKAVVPVDIRAIAKEGGGLNCISWEI